jgi:A/G-specific adenine glycosylase
MLSPQQSRAFRANLLRWYKRHGRDLPWRRTEDPYAILVSEFMLQQTQVGAVRKFYDKWLQRFPTLVALAAASESEVLHAWQGLGYYTRARNLHAAAKALMTDYNGVLPNDPEVLRQLPGLGRYTANAVTTFAFDRPVPIVEANSTRVLTRLFNIDVPIDSAAGRDRLWDTAKSLVPNTDAARFNSALLDLGALICTRRPKCTICPVRNFCCATQPGLLPLKKRRREIVHLTEEHMFVRRRNHVLLQQCVSRWRGMWMLPPLVRQDTKGRRPVHASAFTFTHHRIDLRVFRKLHGRIDLKKHCWFPADQLETIPIPSPHRRAIVDLLSARPATREPLRP